MSEKKSTPSEWEKRVAKTTTRLGFWTFAWVLTMALATFGPKFIWNSNDLLTIAGITLNLLVGFGMIGAHKGLLYSLDEMERKVQFEAMALTLGVAIVVGLAYSNLDVANIIEQDAEISYLVMLMGLTYLSATILGLRRYR